MVGRRSGSSWLAEAVRKTQVETSGLIQAATTGPSCKAFLYTSAFFTNGPQGKSWVDEDAATASLLLAQIHRAGERLVSKAVSAGLAAFPLRVGFVYAPEGNFASFVLDEAAKGRFKYIGDGDNYMPFVHIEDVVSAFVAGIQSPPVGRPVNIVDDQPLKMKSFVEHVVPHFGKKPGGIPRWLAFSLAGRPLPEMFSGSYRLRNDRAKELLGWEPKFSAAADHLDDVVRSYKLSKTESRK